MDFTAGQYAVMEKLDKGLHFDALPESEKEIINYLSRQNIVQPRAQIAEDYMELSQEGKLILAAHIEKESIRQENERRKQAEENEKLQNTVREKADREAERKAEHRFQVWLSFWSALFGAVIGALVSNLDRIIDLIAKLFE